MKHEANGWALAPLALFLVIFLGTGFSLTMNGANMAFYQLSATVAILPAIAWAIWMGKGKIKEKINVFLSGSGESGIITMCMIYLLAGGFASVAKSIGGVESTVNLGLSIVPASMVLPGLFIIAAFIATAMGTSMGTIAAIAPIAVGVAGKTDISSALLMGAVVGGAMFGDNLSMISDTTIAATRTQGCEMGDKFKMNFLIAIPAALVTVIILYIVGEGGQVLQQGTYSLLKVLPYLIILVMAVIGVNVFIVLGAGIVFTGIVGLFSMADFSILKFSQDIYTGFTGMQEILVLSLLIGGLGELIKYHGGITYIINFIGKLTRGTKSTRAGEFSIGALSVFSDLCTANNTVAIILTGGMAKEIAKSHNVDPRRSASLLDIFSCVIQGLIPYGAQILLAGSISQLSPLEIIGNMYYCYILAFVAVISIITGFPRAKR
ncbi:Na+/H+ antiporter NhaC [Maridesulfovibrio ferrireducens]|uniref:Na+/H+ antiporter NhaC n=1 Tax=Maridesulfovibrio ferrireducens TaxID=246191 RepID=A0A1G9HZV7_9BACT|nr:Na+/H+ antiporter NhaC family protein [Maridesulfovibrio ferrireducens]SDL18501.1 Na+/H+ antiporter NhaC [Maridesulfovibrio ferrireducens]